MRAWILCAGLALLAVQTSALLAAAKPDPGLPAATPFPGPASGSSSLEDPAPIRGQLVDDRTGDPIPEFAIDLRYSSERIERVVTDAEGRFASQPQPRRRLSLVLLDHERSPRPERKKSVRTSHDPENAEERRLRIEIGPTFTIALFDPSGEPLAAADAAQRFHAELFHDPPITDGVVQFSERTGWEMRDAPRAPLRVTGDRLWTRFRDRGGERLFAGSPWWLEVRDEEGLWAGGARVESVSGILASPIPIRMERRGVLDLGPVAPPGLLTHVGNGGRQPVQGGRVRWLRPGRVKFEPSRTDLVFIEVPVASEVFSVPIRPGPEPANAQKDALSFRFTTASELALEEDFELWLAKEGQAVPTILPAAATVRFEGLERGTYSLTARGDVFWDGRVLASGVSSREASEIEISIDARTRLVGLQVYDATEGTPIDGAELRWEHGSFVDWSEVGRPQAFRQLELPRGEWAKENTRLTLCASGYKSKEMDLGSLGEDEGFTALRVDLEPGWATVLRTYDRRSRQPLSGVRVFCDGEWTETTDENGEVSLSGPEVPKDLWLELEGYRWVDGSQAWLRTELLAREDFEPLLWLSPER